MRHWSVTFKINILSLEPACEEFIHIRELTITNTTEALIFQNYSRYMSTVYCGI